MEKDQELWLLNAIADYEHVQRQYYNEKLPLSWQDLSPKQQNHYIKEMKYGLRAAYMGIDSVEIAYQAINSMPTEEEPLNITEQEGEMHEPELELLPNYIYTLREIQLGCLSLANVEWRKLPNDKKVRIILRTQSSMQRFIEEQKRTDGKYQRLLREALQDLVARTVIFEDHLTKGLESVGIPVNRQ